MLNEPGPGMREANFQQWIKGLEWIEGLDVEYVVPGHGEICDIDEVQKFKNQFEEMWGLMENLVKNGWDKETSIADFEFEKFFWSDTSRGESWNEHRRRTFRQGLENLYTQVKGS